MSHSYRALFSSIAFVALFSTACDNGAGTGGSDDGSGGATSTSNVTSSSGSPDTTSTGNSMSTTTSTSSGGDVCTPTESDPFCSQATSCQCQAMSGMPAGAPCPNNMGNTCSPGHNQCGCDLDIDVDYQMPDPTCKGNVSGATWQWDDGQFADSTTAQTNDNGQWTVRFGAIFQPDVSYYHGFVLSGKSLSFNLANQEMLDYCSGDFSSDCKSVTLSCFHTGEVDPYVVKTLVFVHY